MKPNFGSIRFCISLFFIFNFISFEFCLSSTKSFGFESFRDASKDVTDLSSEKTGGSSSFLVYENQADDTIYFQDQSSNLVILYYPMNQTVHVSKDGQYLDNLKEWNDLPECLQKKIAQYLDTKKRAQKDGSDTICPQKKSPFPTNGRPRWSPKNPSTSKSTCGIISRKYSSRMPSFEWNPSIVDTIFDWCQSLTSQMKKSMSSFPFLNDQMRSINQTLLKNGSQRPFFPSALEANNTKNCDTSSLMQQKSPNSANSVSSEKGLKAKPVTSDKNANTPSFSKDIDIKVNVSFSSPLNLSVPNVLPCMSDDIGKKKEFSSARRSLPRSQSNETFCQPTKPSNKTNSFETSNDTNVNYSERPMSIFNDTRQPHLTPKKNSKLSLTSADSLKKSPSSSSPNSDVRKLMTLVHEKSFSDIATMLKSDQYSALQSYIAYLSLFKRLQCTLRSIYSQYDHKNRDMELKLKGLNSKLQQYKKEIGSYVNGYILSDDSIMNDSQDCSSSSSAPAFDDQIHALTDGLKILKHTEKLKLKMQRLKFLVNKQDLDQLCKYKRILIQCMEKILQFVPPKSTNDDCRFSNIKIDELEKNILPILD